MNLSFPLYQMGILPSPSRECHENINTNTKHVKVICGWEHADGISYSNQSVHTDSSCPEHLWPRGPGHSVRKGVWCRVATSPLQFLSCNASPLWPWTRKPTQETFCVASGIHLNWPRRRQKGEEEEGEDAAKATWRVSHSRLALPELCGGLATAENAGKMMANFRDSTLVGQQPRENEQLWFPSKQHMLFAGLFRTAVG